MSYESDSRYRFCGIHVHLLVLVLAIIGIISNIAFIVFMVTTLTTRHLPYFSFSPVVSILFYGMLIIANRKKISVLHVIYMILKIVFVIMPLFVLGLLLIIASVVVIKSKDHPDADILRSFFILIGCIYLVITVFEIVSLFIVYRDFRYVKNLTDTPRRVVTVPTVYTQSPPQTTQGINPSAGWNVNAN